MSPREGDYPSVRIAVVGLQHGRDHIRAIKASDVATFVAGCDLKTELAAEAEDQGGRFYTDYQQMLEEERPEAVVLAVPHHLHAPMAEVCLAAGCHLLVEKPIATTLEEADRIIAAARRHSRVLQVGFQRRFAPWAQHAREMVQSGRLGKVVFSVEAQLGRKNQEYFERRPWMVRAAAGGGILFMNAIHNVDYTRFILGNVDEVYSIETRVVGEREVEDGAALTLRFTSGAIGTLTIGDVTPSLEGAHKFTIHGTGGTLDVMGYRLATMADSYSQGAHSQTVDVRPATAAEDQKVAQTRNFVRSIHGLETPLATGEEARASLAVLLAAKRSAQVGRPVRLAEMEPQRAPA